MNRRETKYKETKKRKELIGTTGQTEMNDDRNGTCVTNENKRGEREAERYINQRRMNCERMRGKKRRNKERFRTDQYQSNCEQDVLKKTNIYCMYK